MVIYKVNQGGETENLTVESALKEGGVRRTEHKLKILVVSPSIEEYNLGQGRSKKSKCFYR